MFFGPARRETFSALLCLSNDLAAPPTAATTALSPQLKIEMLTPSQQRHQLSPASPPTAAASQPLQPGGSLELLVQHEVNEMGTHALECTVTYAVRVAGDDGHGAKLAGRSFRKVYRFQVSNPLKVKTKAHAPAASQGPSACLSRAERGKVFLEVLLENLCEEAMAFSRVALEPTADWTCLDANLLPAASPLEPPTALFSADATLLPPGAVRQYLFVCTPTANAAPALPGASQVLGRLDIAWRTPNGEPGRLQTAMLGRRVPVPVLGAGQVVALPLPAPEKPLPPLSDSAAAPGSAALGSPSKGPAPYRPHQQALPALIAVSRVPDQPDAAGLDFDVTLASVSPERVEVDRPFTLTFQLDVRDNSPAPSRRQLRLVAQHVQHHPTALQLCPPESIAQVAARAPLVTLAVPGAAPLQAIPAGTTSLQQQQLRRLENASALSPSGSMDSLRSAAAADARPDPSVAARPAAEFDGAALPRPTPTGAPNPALPTPSRQVVRLGASAVTLPPISLEGTGAAAKAEFGLRFVALEAGFARVGGLRLLLVSSSGEGGAEQTHAGVERVARVVWEQGVVTEVMVGGA